MKVEDLLEGDGEPRGQPLVYIETNPEAIRTKKDANTRLAQLEKELEKTKHTAEEAAVVADEAVRAAKQKVVVEETEEDLAAAIAFPTRLPARLFDERGEVQSYTWLRAKIKDAWRLHEAVSREEPKRYIVGWYAAPGTAATKATPILPRTEFCEGAYKEGTYYLRIRENPDEDCDGDRFYVCPMKAKGGAGGDGDGTSPKVAANLIALRTLEDLRVENRRLGERVAREEKDNDRLREDLRALRDDLATKDREIAAQAAEIDDLKERGEPLLDKDAADDLGVKLILHAKDYLSDPDKKTREQFDKLMAYNRQLYDAHLAFFQKIGEHPEIQRLLVTEARDLYDARVKAFNEAAEAAGEKDRALPATEILALLPPHEEDVSDDAMIAAVKEADARVAALGAELAAEIARADGLEAKVKTLRARVRELEKTLDDALTVIEEEAREKKRPAPSAKATTPAKAARKTPAAADAARDRATPRGPRPDRGRAPPRTGSSPAPRGAPRARGGSTRRSRR